MKYYLLLLLMLFCSQPARADPTAGTEGIWIGSCGRGATTVNATIAIDQLGARLNGQGVTSFVKKDLSLSFVLQGKFTKTFQGNWTPDTNTLTGTFSVAGKTPANCSLVRRAVSTGRICIRNPDAADIWWMASPGNPSSPVRLGGRSEDHGSGSGGKVCWGASEAQARSCTRSLPQSAYGC